MIQPMTDLNVRFVQSPHRERADDDAEADRRQHAADVVPARVLAEHGDGVDVADDQHRQHDAGRVARAKQKREDDDVEQADAGQAGLAQPDAGRRDRREHPLAGRHRPTRGRRGRSPTR